MKYNGRNNVLEEHDDYLCLELTQGKKTLIDKEDYDKVKNYRWYAHTDKTNWYCLSDTGKKQIRLHRFLTNCPKEMVVDHINHDSLDNRKKNLRICTQKQNARNSRKKQKNTAFSKYIGVKNSGAKRQKYAAYICLDGKERFLGSFTYEINAAHAYNESAKKHFGEFACLNKNLPEKINEVELTNKHVSKYGYRGVGFHPNTKTYSAKIGYSGKQHSLGYYKTAKEAAKAYNKAAIKYHGQKAILNIIEE